MATQESSRLAKVLIAQSCSKQEIVAGDLTLHADRGSSMSSKALALLLADLGVTKSHSRPHVCDDNPYSESQFKPSSTVQNSRLVSAPFSKPETSVGISSIGITATPFGYWPAPPEDVHYRSALATRRNRAHVLEAAHALFPEPNGKPVPPPLPEAVWINPPEKENS